MHDAYRPIAMQPLPAPGWRPERCDRIALVLQGGGALGAYQAGVYQALHEAGIEPDWVSGVSIGAINSAIIAGNPPEHRLRAAADLLGADHRAEDLALHAGRRHFPQSAQRAQLVDDDHAAASPAFSRRTLPIRGSASPARARRRATTTPRRCARRCWNWSIFDLINEQRSFRGRRRQCAHRQLRLFRQRERTDRARARHGERRAAAGVADDQDRHRPFLGRRHRLQHAAAASARPGRQLNTLVFQVDLFSARGVLPRDIQDVMARHKDIMYSSRTRYNTDVYRRIHNLKTLLARRWQRSRRTS